MRLGIMCGAPGTDQGPSASIQDYIDYAKKIEALGFSTLWMAHIFGLDAISVLGLAGRETSKLELGTAVVRSHGRHPIEMAQAAMTSSVAAQGRFTLGIGVAHKIVIEGNYGLSFDRPARHMREYLEILRPLLNGEVVKHKGEQYQVRAKITVPGAKPTPLLLAALGDRMLDLAGQVGDGTITWLCGPETLSKHIIPKISLAANKAGRPAPRIVCGLPTILVAKSQVASAKDQISKSFELYGTIPSYRAMLDREGVTGPADVAMVGDESDLRKKLNLYRDLGVTDFDAAIADMGESANRTLEFLASEL